MRKRLLPMLVIGLLAASLLAGCKPKPPATQMVLDPKTVKSWPVDYWVASDAAKTAISPDGKYVLLVQGGSENRVVAAVPLAADDQKDVALFSVPNSYLEVSSLDFIPVGWLSKSEAMFLSVGWQAQGPNKGKRGIEVFSGDISKGSSREMTFIPLDEDYVHNVTYLPDSGRVLLDITQAIWSVDVKSKAAKLVKGNLPTYDGMFMARLAPDASAYIYELHEIDRPHGVFMLDASTGEERVLAANGDTMGFYPSWSPDSKYIAMYTVPRKPGRTGTTWNDYEVYPGEDGPMGISPSITVLDRSGNLVRSISVEGKVLSNFKWSSDSKSIAFAAGPRPSSTPDTDTDWEIPVIAWDSIYSAKPQEQAAPTKLGDLAAETGEAETFISPLAFDPQNRGVFLQITTGSGYSSIWYAAAGRTPIQTADGKPVKIADGYWQFYPEAPVYGDSIAAAIGSPSGQIGLWLLSANQIKKAAEWSGSSTMVVGYNQSILVTTEMGSEGGNTMVVRSMFTEKTVETGK